ncbi:hypothetical protein [Luxibacter massiliensis]|uniref:hypothetical protein n=1 Tax=Luxibacter massiliensis TaxID=2219695 RepID=UPI000F06B2BB|nr:hypothetical protein [Luxibacter massiliensis]DAJ00482.1 MAG TPA: Protein of unknown function (DUF1574) [Caudoviricetes sp.]
MLKKILKPLCFVIILAILLICFVNIFSFKYGDGIYPLKRFYEEKENSMDVMCFGSSHVFQNINTGVLWDEYGIADFNLCGSVQPFWNTYYYMKEALKSQQPAVMVLDVYGAIQTEDYIDHSRIIKNNFGLKLSKDKIDSVKVSSPQEQWTDYLLEYPTYHNRYSEISRSDFTGFLGNKSMYENYKGFSVNQASYANKEPAGFYTNDTEELTGKAEEYLRKIIELAQENDIPLVMVKSPYPSITQEHQRKYNRVGEIAEEYGVPFLNFNLLYDELGLDFSKDFADTGHLNYLGNIKYTKYLAEYLKSNYEIPDRRGEKGYQSYDKMSGICRQQLYNAELKAITDIGHYVDKAAQSQDYLVVYNLKGNYKSMTNYDAVKEKLLTAGINLDEADKDHVWAVQNGEVIFSGDSAETFTWHTELGNDNNLMISCSAAEEGKIEVSLNHAQYSTVTAGLDMFIYDTYTEAYVESGGFALSGNKLSYGKTVKAVE